MTKKKFFEMLAGATRKPKTISTQDRTGWGTGKPKYTAIVVYWENTFDPSTVKTVKGHADPAEVKKYQDWLQEYLAQ